MVTGPINLHVAALLPCFLTMRMCFQTSKMKNALPDVYVFAFLSEKQRGCLSKLQMSEKSKRQKPTVHVRVRAFGFSKNTEAQ
jgi:hypothetical protein